MYNESSIIITTPKNEKIFQNLEKENQFTFDINKMSYMQYRYSSRDNSFYDELKEEAIKKITKLKKQNDQSDEEEEEESSESEYISEEGNNDEFKSNNSSELAKEKKEDSSIINEDKKINEELITPNTPETPENLNLDNKKEKQRKSTKNEKEGQFDVEDVLIKMVKTIKKVTQDDFYHINFNKITYYVFNYTSGYVEEKKGHIYKISQVTHVMEEEKEKHKNFDSKTITKFMKGKKRGNLNKKEENEINPHDNIHGKLKEIYKALSSKDCEKTLKKLFLFSILIFILIIGTGVMNILIFEYLKDSIYSFFFLIQKSDNLYQNLLFEISLVKEMLIIKNPYYNNTINPNKELYYFQLSKMIYSYYKNNTFILSNITNNLNILNPEDEKSITQKKVDIYILDHLKESKFFYQYKTYSILVYSAFRELNAALYHISQLTIDDIYHYQDDVFYFLRNGMSNLIICSENQMWTLVEKFEEKVKAGNIILIICSVAIFIIYFFCGFIFSYYNKDVLMKRHNYLIAFKELDRNLVISFLKKCEKFLKTLQVEDKDEKNKKKKFLIETSYENYSSQSDDEFLGFFINDKNKNSEIVNNKNNKIENKKLSRYNYIFSIILFFLFFAIQIGSYIFYYSRMVVYKNITIYEYYISIYASNFIFIFIIIREYMFNRQFIFYNQTIQEYTDNTLSNYYVILAQSSKMKDIYRVYFPDSYQKFLNYLYSSSQMCDFINTYISEYPTTANTDCDRFFIGSTKTGFFGLLVTFVEEIRTLKDQIDYLNSLSDEKNFTYNESLFNDPKGYYEEYYKQYENNIEEYKKFNPANILNTDYHKRLYITFLYINIQVYSLLISESLDQFENVFKKYNSINLIVNIIFLAILVVIFFVIWIPFVCYEKNSFEKVKNMITIFPSDLLMEIRNINSLLDIG